MLFLECEVRKPGALHNTHIIAVVADRFGNKEQVIVDKSFLTFRAGRSFLPVWLISQDQKSKLVQVELPQEAASGANRIWVKADNTFIDEREEKAS